VLEQTYCFVDSECCGILVLLEGLLEDCSELSPNNLGIMFYGLRILNNFSRIALQNSLLFI
jgi:hypothetical protein